MADPRSFSDTVELSATNWEGEVRLTFRVAGGGVHRFASRPRSDIDAANDSMFDALDAFSLDVWEWDTLDSAKRRAHLEAMSSAGRALADALFGPELQTFVGLLTKYRARRLELFVLDDTFSPYWDFLRVVNDGIETYLGDLVTVTPWYTLRAEQAPGSMVDEFQITALEDPSIGPVGLVEDETLLSACQDRMTRARASIEEIYTLIPVVKNLSEIDILPPMSPGARPNDVAMMNKWLGPERRLVHFNCHGSSATRGRNDDPELQVTRRFAVGKKDLHTCDLTYGLVNLNVCNSAVGTYSSRKTFSQAFHDQNAEATICTTGSVDDSFATVFSRELYTRLADQDLLTAMHETRRVLLNRHNHPMSLMYTFTGTGSFRLDTV